MARQPTSTGFRARRLIRGRFPTYLGIGLASFGLDLTLLILVREWLGAPVWLAATISYWVTVGFNFSVNRAGPFRDHQTNRWTVIRYAALLALNWLATIGVLQLARAIGIQYPIAKVGAVVLLSLVNFVAYSRWVFCDRPVARGLM